MKARDIISPRSASAPMLPSKNVRGDMSVADTLSRMLDTSDHQLGVTEGKELIGIIDEWSMLEGLGKLIAPRDDSSMLTLETSPSAYSASQIARAVEDADVHLVDLWTYPGEEGQLIVTLRVRTTDPSSVVSNLERYGYNVVESLSEENRNMEVAVERLLSLKTLLGV